MASDLDGVDGPGVIDPPFRVKERKEAQQNFPIRTGETTYPHLQHFIRVLTASGRVWIVIKNTFLPTLTPDCQANGCVPNVLLMSFS